jgi:hypothetical protein
MTVFQEEPDNTQPIQLQHILDANARLSKTRWGLQLAGRRQDDLDLLQLTRPSRKDSTDPTDHDLRMIWDAMAVTSKQKSIVG